MKTLVPTNFYSDGTTAHLIGNSVFHADINGIMNIPPENQPDVNSSKIPYGFSALISEFNVLVNKVDDKKANLLFSLTLENHPKHYPSIFRDCQMFGFISTIASKQGAIIHGCKNTDDEFYVDFSLTTNADTLDKLSVLACSVVKELRASADNIAANEGLDVEIIFKQAGNLALAEEKEHSYKQKIANKSYDVYNDQIMLDLQEARSFPFSKFNGKLPIFISKMRDGEMVGQPLFRIWKISDSLARVEILFGTNEIQTLRSVTSFENLFLKALIYFLNSLPKYQLQEYNLESEDERICFSFIVEENNLSSIIDQSLAILN